MAWQVKTKYTGAPSGEFVLKSDDGTLGGDIKALYDQYENDGFILNQTRETIDANTKVDTITFLSEQKYTDYRNAIISIIGDDESKFSSHTVEVIEQKEV